MDLLGRCNSDTIEPFLPVQAELQVLARKTSHVREPPLARSVTVPPTSAVESFAALLEARFTASFIAVIVMLLSECWLTGS
jgi:hypothetical protein